MVIEDFKTSWWSIDELSIAHGTKNVAHVKFLWPELPISHTAKVIRMHFGRESKPTEQIVPSSWWMDKLRRCSIVAVAQSSCDSCWFKRNVILHSRLVGSFRRVQKKKINQWPRVRRWVKPVGWIEKIASLVLSEVELRQRLILFVRRNVVQSDRLLSKFTTSCVSLSVNWKGSLVELISTRHSWEGKQLWQVF